MKYLKSYKIFEGVYDDAQNKIMDLENDILDTAEDYQKEVTDCFSELADKYKHTKWEGTEDNQSEYLSTVYDFEIGVGKYFEFFEDYEDVFDKLKGYIGKIPRMSIYYNGPYSDPPNNDIHIFQTSYSMNDFPYEKLTNYMTRELKMKLFIKINVWDVVNNKFTDYIHKDAIMKIKFIL